MKQKIYIDMDGTLCRFHDTEHKYVEQMWQPGFYAGLKPFEEMLSAISLCIDRNPTTEFYILSAILDTDPPFAEAEKREWLHTYLPQISDKHMIFVPAGHDKAQYIASELSQNTVLIDDYNRNLNNWQEQGGTAIKFVNDINNHGLGAYGGEKGALWDGMKISYNDSAMAICLAIEHFTGIERNGKDATSFYGFPEDVLPEDFCTLIGPYFQMRQKSDAEAKKAIYKLGTIFNAYDDVSKSIIGSIQKQQIENKRPDAFKKKYGLNKAMMQCLDKLYFLAQTSHIGAQQCEALLLAAIHRRNEWRTSPVTPSSLELFWANIMERDEQLGTLYQQIEALSGKYKALSRKLYMPMQEEIVGNLLLDNQVVPYLQKELLHTEHKLSALKAEWQELTKESYPLVPLGNGTRKFSQYQRSDKNQPKPHR